jgi:hypothetical protein
MANGDRSSYSPTKWLEKEIDRLQETKAEKSSMNTMLGSLDRDITEVRNKLRETAKRAEREHACTQIEFIKANAEEVQSWSKWWKGTIAALISAVVVVGSVLAAVWYKGEALTTGMEAMQGDFSTIQSDVQEIKESQSNLELVVSESQRKNSEKEEQRVKELKSLLQDAIHEARQDMKPRARRRSN